MKLIEMSFEHLIHDWIDSWRIEGWLDGWTDKWSDRQRDDGWMIVRGMVEWMDGWNFNR